MGAISLYRGNLHRVPDVPRRWLMPTRQISLTDFKTLLHRRSRALRRRRTTTTATPNSTSREEATKDNPLSNADAASKAEQLIDQGELGVADFSPAKAIGDESVPATGLKPVSVGSSVQLTHGKGNSQAFPEENQSVSKNPNPETKLTIDTVNASNDKEKRKKEVEEKLQVLNEKKHNLILNAEEELKRRNSMQMQALAGRPPVPLQVDVGNDSGSMNRHVTPRLHAEGNVGGDMEGGEADDKSNHNMHSRHLLRMSSVSPSSESPHRKPAFLQHNVVPHPSRANLGVTSSPSPSRFAPTGHQTHPANLPTLSGSGTSYIASSPSPAASGGTSVFREARLPSPWN